MLRISSIWTLFIQKYLITVKGLKIVCIDKRLDWKKYMYMYHLKISLPCNHYFWWWHKYQFYIHHRFTSPNTETKNTRYRLHEPVTILPTCKNMLPWQNMVTRSKKATQVNFRFNLSFSLFVISNCWDWKSFPKDHIHFFL